MNKQLKVIEEYLENSYSGAKMMNDIEAMCRISRAIAALKADLELEIFTQDFKESLTKEHCLKRCKYSIDGWCTNDEVACENCEGLAEERERCVPCMKSLILFHEDWIIETNFLDLSK